MLARAANPACGPLPFAPSKLHPGRVMGPATMALFRPIVSSCVIVQFFCVPHAQKVSPRPVVADTVLFRPAGSGIWFVLDCLGSGPNLSR